MNIFQKWQVNHARKVLKNLVSGNEVWQTLGSYLGVDLNSAVGVRGAAALAEATIYTCIKLLSEGLAKLPAEVYQDQGNGIEKAVKHYLYSLLHMRPNPYMSSMSFWQTLEVQRNIYGNAYAWIERYQWGPNAGRVKALWPLFSARMQIWVDFEGLLSTQDQIWYVYYDLSGVQHKLQSDDVLHFRGMSLDGIYGVSPVDKLATLVDNGIKAQTFLNNSLTKGMQAAGLIQYIGDLSEEKKNEFRDRFETMANGLANANRVALMPIGYQFQPLTLKLTDSQFVENIQLIYRQIAAAFGVKAHQLNDMLRTSYASASEANSEFYTDSLLPILTIYEQECTYKLFTTLEVKRGLYVRFNVDTILRADKETRYKTYQTGINSGFLKPNEAREQEGLPKVDGADGLFLNGSIVPIDQAGVAYIKSGGDAKDGKT